MKAVSDVGIVLTRCGGETVFFKVPLLRVVDDAALSSLDTGQGVL